MSIANHLLPEVCHDPLERFLQCLLLQCFFLQCFFLLVLLMWREHVHLRVGGALPLWERVRLRRLHVLRGLRVSCVVAHACAGSAARGTTIACMTYTAQRALGWPTRPRPRTFATA